jgi:hypothetical protein
VLLGWNRTRIDGIDVARTWWGWGVLIDKRDGAWHMKHSSTDSPWAMSTAADHEDFRRLIPVALSWVAP